MTWPPKALAQAAMEFAEEVERSGLHEAMGFERFGDVDGMFPRGQTEAFFVKILEP